LGSGCRLFDSTQSESWRGALAPVALPSARQFRPAAYVQVSIWSYAYTVLFVDLQLNDVGFSISLRTTLSQITPATLGGTGTVTYNSTLSPTLPIVVGNINRGSAFKIRLYFNVPSTVTKLMLTETGSMSSSAGTMLSYTQSQTLNR